MTVEKELGRRRRQIEVVADGLELGVAAAGDESTETGARQAGQRPPWYLVPCAANVENDPTGGSANDQRRCCSSLVC